MKKDNNKVLKIVFGAFLWFGAFFLVLGICIFIGSNKTKQSKAEKYDEVTAVISQIHAWRDSDGDRRHDVYLDYTYNGEDYGNVRYNRYSSRMYEGMPIEVWVNKTNPTKFYSGDIGVIISLSFGGFGLVFGLIGAIPLAIIWKKELHKKKLLATGQQLWGAITAVTNNPTITVNGRHPQYFIVKYEDDSIVTVAKDYRSENVWIEGDRERFVGRNVKIYVNPQNNDDYVVDLDSLQDY